MERAQREPWVGRLGYSLRTAPCLVLTAVGRLTAPRVSLTPASAVICGRDLPLMSGYSPICPCGFQFRIISDSGCNYSDITSNKDPDITPSSFYVYHSPAAPCFGCDADFKDYSLNCYREYIITHSMQKAPWRPKPYSNHLCGKNRTVKRTCHWQ